MAAASARLSTTPPAHATHPGATMRLPSAVAAANTSAIAASGRAVDLSGSGSTPCRESRTSRG